ncbi:MAG: hypothetical protein JNM85_09095 [Chthonomonas sp.]|nr:hypothetical protein [Chthonomonas sp.]
MKLVFITDDNEVIKTTKDAYRLGEEVVIHADWHAGLDACDGADMIFVDLVTTLADPHKIAGYEQFAAAKMAHPVASKVPLVLIAPEPEYELDFMAGWPDFVFTHIRKPVNEKIFRRVVTYI